MRTKSFGIVACLFLLLTVMIIFITPAYADEQGEWITKYTVRDSTGAPLLDVDFETGTNSSYSPLVAGAELQVTFTIRVPMTAPNTLTLRTGMDHSTLQDRYWQLVTQNYSGITNYNPNSQSVGFTQVAGDLVMVCYGRIPTSAVTTEPVQFPLIQLLSPSGEVLDQIAPQVVNAKIDEYLKLLQSSENKLQSLIAGGVSPAYTELFQDVITQAQAEGAQGYIDNAIALLNQLTSAPEPSSAIMELLFLPIVGVVAAVAGVLGFLFLRNRGKIKYVNLVIEDQIKDLEGLTLRASKIDRTISSSLETVEDRLKRLVGM